MKNNALFNIKSLIIVGMLLASIFPLWVAAHYPLYLNDDSFITLTYVKNLVHGRGFVFNHAPATLGTTTPLFTIIVAGIAFILPKIEIVHIAVYFTALCWASIPWLFLFFHNEWGLKDWEAGIIGLVVLGSGWIAYLGMEAYLFAFLLVFCFSMFFRSHYWSTGFLSGLLFLTRGEGILVLMVIVVYASIQYWHQHHKLVSAIARIIINICAGFLIPVIAWSIYAYITFGVILPNTLAAKQAQGQNGLGRPFFQRLITEWIPSWGLRFSLKGFPTINFWWIVSLIGVFSVVWIRRKWLCFIAWVILFISGYILLGVSAYSWYQLPILFVMQLLFGLGILAITNFIIKFCKSRLISGMLLLAFLSIMIYTLSYPTIMYSFRYKGDYRGESYIKLCQWLRENTTEDESIAFIEIGYLGYFTDNRIIDLAGLVLPKIVKHVTQRDFAWGFWHYKPDYYIYSPAFDWALGDIISDERFNRQYSPITRLDSPFENDFTIYKRIK